jgi:hypothetical protein
MEFGRRLSVIGFKQTQAEAFDMQLHSFELRNAEDIDKAFAEAPKSRVDAVLVVISPFVTLHSKRIVELALKHRFRACIRFDSSSRKVA